MLTLLTRLHLALWALLLGLSVSTTAFAQKKTSKFDAAAVKKQLESGDADDIASACETIRKAKAASSKAADPLAAVLRRGLNKQLSVVCLDAAGAMASEGLSPAVAPYLRHRDSEISRAAAKALGRTKGDAAIKALRWGLRSKDASVRGLSATGLGNAGATEAMADLFLALKRRVGEAAGAIGQLCEPKDCAQFLELLGSQKFDVMTAGLDQMLFRDPKELSDDEKLKVVGALRELGTPEAGKYLSLVVARWPEDWSKRIRKALDAAVKATGGDDDDDEDEDEEDF